MTEEKTTLAVTYKELEYLYLALNYIIFTGFLTTEEVTERQRLLKKLENLKRDLAYEENDMRDVLYDTEYQDAEAEWE